jgi:hypothetical protein
VVVWVTYAGKDYRSGAVLFVEGRQVTLSFENAIGDFGGRYSFPSDAASYVWETDLSDGRLLWRESGKETLLLDCGSAQ